MHKIKCYVLLFCFLIVVCSGQAVIEITGSSTLVSDGVGKAQEPIILPLEGLASAEACKEIYGFLPCSRTALGNAFLVLVYGYLMYLAAKFMSDGSEDLLEILGPGIVGGLILPVLSSLPDALIILASGINGSKEVAQIEVSVGMGLLAGSTVMALTIVWGSCVVAGKCDLIGSKAKDKQDTKGLSLTESGVSTDIWTCYSARIMLASVIPFIIVQLPQLPGMISSSRIVIMASLILSISLLIGYCLYQVSQPWIQKRRLAYAKHKHVISGILKHLQMCALGRLVGDDGAPNTEVLAKLFNTIDENGDGYLSASELRALIIGIEFQGINLDEHDAVDKVMKEFDTSGDFRVDLVEFTEGIRKWLTEAKKCSKYQHREKKELQLISDFHTQTRMERYLLGDEDDEEVEKIENARWNAFKSVVMLILGTALAFAFAHPFADTINTFSTKTVIPPFFIAFVVIPFVRSSEGFGALIFAKRKKQRTASLTFSQIYAAVTMSHIFSLSVFLALVYIRDLKWDFSAEVMIIIVVCLVVGILVSFQTTFPLWTSFMAFLLYPISPLLVYILNYKIHLPNLRY
ncbi:hypothetical protein M9H77_21129 [Catharanthus roseus]|uniref:Uncharacterized protein n=1 Tax=Catharanthus roseus TaxID=4058 RepID=A0ACC0AMG9_CATRO|nr:hypothetical protein M9H77_21129 [Catharanthus roseus]